MVVALAISLAILAGVTPPATAGRDQNFSSVVGSLNDVSALKFCSLTPVLVSDLCWI